MKINNRAGIFGLLLSAALTLTAPASLGAQAPESPEVFRLRPDDVTIIMARSGSPSGNVNTNATRRAMYGFDTPQDTIAWTVNAPKEGDYTVSLLFSSNGQWNIEVRCGKSVLVVPSLLKTWENRPDTCRQKVPGTLHLKAGENQIAFRLLDASAPEAISDKGSSMNEDGITKTFYLYSIELGTPTARKAQVVRAKAIRGDTSWMIAGKYGLFVHWSAMSYPYQGDERRAAWVQKSVGMFDVKVFADAVDRTGAAWVTFTATHQGFYWPGPNAALDKILPGRTATRDLLGEIIDELGRRGIRTLLYLHTGYNGSETEFWKAAGARDADTKRFSDNIASILRDCSLRYGKKLSGFSYIDCGLGCLYPLDPLWEDWARAIKAGNPSAVMGLSTNNGPTVSPFSELSVTDNKGVLTRPDPSLIGPGRQLGDVTPAVWTFMDGWFSQKPMNGDFSKGPRYSTKEYVDFIQQMAAAKIPVTINLIITADVTDEHPIFNPECMEVMDEVRKAIRGK